jgi:hypothetical protein
LELNFILIKFFFFIIYIYFRAFLSAAASSASPKREFCDVPEASVSLYIVDFM